MERSNVKNERTNIPISFGNETFWYRSWICLIENRLFGFGPELALLDQIEVIFFDRTNSETNSNFWFHFYSISKGLWNVCSFTVLTLLVESHFSWERSCQRLMKRICNVTVIHTKISLNSIFFHYPFTRKVRWMTKCTHKECLWKTFKIYE